MSREKKYVMSKAEKLMPELRFSEFLKKKKWAIKRLDNVVIDFIVPMRDKPKKLDGKIPWCRIEDFDGMYLSNSKSDQGVSLETVKKMNLKVYPINTLLVSCSADLGRCAITQTELVTNQTFIGLVPDTNEIDTVYFYFIMTNSRNELNARSSGTTISYLSRREFEKFEIAVPTPQEQQKIAACLSSLDELIAAHADKLDVLKDHKKGLMQNLFPQEDQKEPNYRFAEFERDGDWIFEQFSKVYSFLVTNSFSRAKLNYDDGNVRNIHYGDIHTKFSMLFDITKERVPYVNSDISLDRIKEENYCKIGDVVFADASEDLDDVGKSMEIINLSNEQVLAGLHTLLARQIEPKLTVGFGGYLFKSSAIRKQIKREAQGAKVLGISGTRLSRIKVYYPKKKSEQQKIVSCLSELDELITAQENKIEQLQQHKKGLMQGLFPKIDR